MALTRIEKNEVFKALAESALDPAECTLEQNGNEVVITHTNSGSTFKFIFVGTGHIDIYQIQSDVVDGHHLRFQAAYRIDSVTPWITSWANETKEIMDAPDLWTEIRRSRELVAVVLRADSSNAPFTQGEQHQILAQLQEIKEQLGERFELSDEQVAQVNEKMDELAEASAHFGRKEWLMIFIGVITTLIVAAIVTPGIGSYILLMLIHGIGHLFGGGPPQILS